MRKMRKVAALALSAAMIVGMLSGCGSTDAGTTSGSTSSAGGSSSGKTGKVYYLNFKPEIADVYESVAADYKAETGVEVKVVTAASGEYESTLKSEIAKSDAPTLFQINGPVGYQNWKDYCADLKDTELYSKLSDQSLAVTGDDGGVYGIPYAVEGYGIIYNNEIMDKYFALDSKKAAASSMDDITDFASLKEVVEDMQANADALGIKGVFASTSFASGEDWRWQTHLLNLPLEEEFAEKTDYSSPVLAGLASKEIEFKYADGFKNIFDLYINNSCTKSTLLSGKTVDNSMAEFALGQCAMVQNGNWGWGQISNVDGNVVKEDQIKMLPIYTGSANDSSRGLCIGTENFFAVNKNASAEDQQASIDFITWLFTSETGKGYVSGDLGFIAPFNTFNDDEKPADPLAKEVMNWMSKDGVTSVPWAFTAFPSENFKKAVGSALLEYVNGNSDWDKVVSTTKEQWAAEYASVNGQ